MKVLDAQTVRQRLSYAACIPLVREAMIAFSGGQTRQLLRSIIPLADGHMFGIMPGALGADGIFGAKLVSVWPENFAAGKPSHQGVVVLFDPISGAPTGVVDAGAITAIRTAAASAVATDALARSDATRLTVLGYGEQAEGHIRAIAEVRPISDVRIWGRRPDRAAAFAERIAAETGIAIKAARSVEAAVDGADIICTCTNAAEPILLGRWIEPGTHLNLVGSSVAGPSEVDDDLVAMSRFIADSRVGALAQGAEFLRAKAAGRVDDDHIVGEIGEVLAGRIPGRERRPQITAYKSLGHVVQDLAAAAYLTSTD
jgi:ornithine cyclodeaminase/alanine dehydrogenase-like protein (mu-crystallin family)